MSSDGNFDRFLIAHLKNSQPYLADEGFTAQVLTKLPATKNFSPPSAWLFIGITVLAILLFGLSQLPLIAAASVATATHLAQWIVSIELMDLLRIGTGLFAATILACAGWLVKDMRLL